MNPSGKGIKYTVADVVEQGSDRVVKLFPVMEGIQDKETTYYCFIETKNDVSGNDFRLEFLDEVIAENMTPLSYITEDNHPYLFDENAPVAFILSSEVAAKEFIDYDEIINENN